MNTSLRNQYSYLQGTGIENWYPRGFPATRPRKTKFSVILTLLAPSHYLIQCWLIAYWAHGNTFQWNLNRNSFILIQEMRLKMPSAKWWPFCPGGDELKLRFIITGWLLYNEDQTLNRQMTSHGWVMGCVLWVFGKTHLLQWELTNIRLMSRISFMWTDYHWTWHFYNVLPTLQSIPLMTNGLLYPITQDFSCHGQHTMPRNP